MSEESTSPNPFSSVPPTRVTSVPLEANSLLPFAQLGLRLLGIMFFIEGVACLLFGLVQAFFLAKQYTDQGYIAPLDPHSTGSCAQGAALLFVGCYLILGGEWILRNIFTPVDVEKNSIHPKPYKDQES